MRRPEPVIDCHGRRDIEIDHPEVTVSSQVEASADEPDSVPDASPEVDKVALLVAQLGAKTSQSDCGAKLQPVRSLVVEDPRLIVRPTEQGRPASEAAGHNLDLVLSPAQDAGALQHKDAPIRKCESTATATGDRDRPVKCARTGIDPGNATRHGQEQLSVQIDGDAVNDLVSCLSAAKYNSGLNARRSLDDHRRRVIYGATQGHLWQRRDLWRHDQVLERDEEFAAVRRSVYQLGEEVPRREKARQHGFEVRPIEQKHDWLLPAEHVSLGLASLARHGKEDTPGTDEPLGDSPGELGNRIEGGGFLLPLC